MHILIAILYAGIIWLSMLSYTIMIDGFWTVVIVAAPVILSALTVGLLALEEIVSRIGKRLSTAKPP